MKKITYWDFFKKVPITTIAGITCIILGFSLALGNKPIIATGSTIFGIANLSVPILFCFLSKRYVVLQTPIEEWFDFYSNGAGFLFIQVANGLLALFFCMYFFASTEIQPMSSGGSIVMVIVVLLFMTIGLVLLNRKVTKKSLKKIEGK